ncbi:MAG: HDIG domain-containing protein [Candidatus Aminicenantes bacterium]|nr:HDIG domain-containing protein [Candidatus Aminicenantes bacterium]
MFKLKFLKTPKAQAANGKGKRRTSLFTLLVGLLFVTVLSYLLYIPQQKTIVDSDLKVGDIVEEDIVIKKDITIEDEESTGKKREAAVEAVVPTYEYYAENRTRSHDLIKDWFVLIKQSRKNYVKNRSSKKLSTIKQTIEKQFGLDIRLEILRDILSSNIFNEIDLNELLKFSKSLYEKKIITSRIGVRRSKQDTIKISTTGAEPLILKTGNLYDLKEAKIALNDFLKGQKMPVRERLTIAPILMEFVDVNLSYSINLTQEEELRVAARVDPVIIKLKSGKLILRKGDEITAKDLRIIKLISEAEKTRELRLPFFFLIMAILIFLSLFGRNFFKKWKSDSLNRERLLVVTGATLIISAVVYRLSLFLLPLILKNISIIEFNYNIKSIYYAIPFGVGALIIAFTFTLQSAVLYSFVNSIIGGIICNWDFRIVLYVLLGNLTVCFGLEYFQRLKRSPIIKTGIFWLMPVNIIIIVLFNLTEANINLELITINVSMGILSAFMALILANFIIPIWEIIFNLITELKLIELANLNLPIFREMLEKAPGTYHHSQMVASLAEAAAPDLGLSPLMLTTMALYHDIGKIDNPHLFTENHTIYSNPHNHFSPRESAKNIIAHIPDGLERANKIKLPDIVQAAISQHHGTKMVRFFYDKAREMSSIDTEDFDETAFRYQGEKPRMIESAVIMLADQVEAASKSLASPTEEEIKNVIQDIINANIEENQFDECEGLTFKALNIIASSFHQKLFSIYHMRVSYPGFNFKDKKENNKK